MKQWNGVPAKKGRYAGRRIVYDHKHKDAEDEGTPYDFLSAYQLIGDFWKAVDETLKQVKR